MTFRITLLVLVTGLFATIWTQDQSQPNHRGSSLAKHREPHQPVIANIPRSRAVSIVSEEDRPAAEIPLEDLWMFGGVEMPLPDGLVPGEYRVVSNTGVVQRLTLTLEDLTAYHQTQPTFITRDTYQSQDEHHRWYFIRVQSSEDLIVPVIAERGKHVELLAVAERGVHPPRPAVAERDESWRTQQLAGQIILRAGRDMARGLSAAVKNRRKLGRLFRREGWSEMAEGLEQTLRGMKPPFRLSSPEAGQHRL